jgi:hypothetical protein
LTSKEREISGEVLYEIVDGELRYRAALKNGDKDINCQIDDLSPIKAFKKGISANRLNKPEWFEDYLAMEYLLKNSGPDVKKQEIAPLFEVEPTIVSRATKILAVLNEASRDLVLKNLQKSPDSWKIAENTLYQLSDLRDLNTLEAALRIALDRQMTAAQAKSLVKWVQAGNTPETYKPQTAPKTSKALNTEPTRTPGQTEHTENKPVPTETGTSPNSKDFGEGAYHRWFEIDEDEPPVLVKLLGGIVTLFFIGALIWQAVTWIIHLFK